MMSIIYQDVMLEPYRLRQPWKNGEVSLEGFVRRF
jgi:hypothetical protein